ncbi:uncharacterized protein LOC130533331 isoform X2 [Takifugu flavidus]|uniref:uncharacterized protein LOC130533331 isoform X2 n=1 Tax=Takifugu flavidus TaxID=433684 RepID=UPI0025445359|nr:uncharacterized protein LOC130533331 isoform X2 [Takifugu flavidus]
MDDTDEADDAPLDQPTRFCIIFHTIISWSDGTEKQAKEPSARVHQPGSTLAVAGHQSPKCPAGDREMDTCLVDSPCSSTSSSDVEQASTTCTRKEEEDNSSTSNKSVSDVPISLENKDEEDSETLSSQQSGLFIRSLVAAEAAAEQLVEESAMEIWTLVCCNDHFTAIFTTGATSSSDEEEENPSS